MTENRPLMPRLLEPEFMRALLRKVGTPNITWRCQAPTETTKDYLERLAASADAADYRAQVVLALHGGAA